MHQSKESNQGQIQDFMLGGALSFQHPTPPLMRGSELKWEGGDEVWKVGMGQNLSAPPLHPPLREQGNRKEGQLSNIGKRSIYRVEEKIAD